MTRYLIALCILPLVGNAVPISNTLPSPHITTSPKDDYLPALRRQGRWWGINGTKGEDRSTTTEGPAVKQIWVSGTRCIVLDLGEWKSGAIDCDFAPTPATKGGQVE